MLKNEGVAAVVAYLALAVGAGDSVRSAGQVGETQTGESKKKNMRFYALDGDIIIILVLIFSLYANEY